MGRWLFPPRRCRRRQEALSRKCSSASSTCSRVCRSCSSLPPVRNWRQHRLPACFHTSRPAASPLQSQLAAVAAVWSGGPDPARPFLLPCVPLAGQPLWHRRHPAAGAVQLSWVLHAEWRGQGIGERPAQAIGQLTVPRPLCMLAPCRQ
jgi:hypothetical protein